jgi:hypothetical protein
MTSKARKDILAHKDIFMKSGENSAKRYSAINASKQEYSHDWKQEEEVKEEVEEEVDEEVEKYVEEEKRSYLIQLDYEAYLAIEKEFDNLCLYKYMYMMPKSGDWILKLEKDLKQELIDNVVHNGSMERYLGRVRAGNFKEYKNYINDPNDPAHDSRLDRDNEYNRGTYIKRSIAKYLTQMRWSNGSVFRAARDKEWKKETAKEEANYEAPSAHKEKYASNKAQAAQKSSRWNPLRLLTRKTTSVPVTIGGRRKSRRRRKSVSD